MKLIEIPFKRVDQTASCCLCNSLCGTGYWSIKMCSYPFEEKKRVNTSQDCDWILWYACVSSWACVMGYFKGMPCVRR